MKLGMMLRSKPLEEISDDTIAARVASARATIREIDSLGPADVRGREDETLRRYGRAVEVIETGQAELAARRQEAIIANAPVRRAFQEDADAREARRKQREPIAFALRRVSSFRHPELEGERLDPSQLTEEDGAALKALVSQKLALAFGDDGAEPLSDEDTAEYERLLGVAAGDPGLFQRKRQAAAARAKVRELAKARRRHKRSL